MICEIYNKMGKFLEYVYGPDWYYANKAKLWEVVLTIILFLATLFVISWWLLPIRLIFKKYGNITFYCKNNKGE